MSFSNLAGSASNAGSDSNQLPVPVPQFSNAGMYPGFPLPMYQAPQFPMAMPTPRSNQASTGSTQVNKMLADTYKSAFIADAVSPGTRVGAPLPRVYVMCTSTEIRFIEASEPVTDLEVKFTEA